MLGGKRHIPLKILQFFKYLWLSCVVLIHVAWGGSAIWIDSQLQQKCYVLAVASVSNINIWCYSYFVPPRRFRETAWYSEWHPQNFCRLLAVDLTSGVEISCFFVLNPCTKKGKQWICCTATRTNCPGQLCYSSCEASVEHEQVGTVVRGKIGCWWHSPDSWNI